MPQKAIKVNRTPIHRDFCDCWGGKLFTIKNNPHLYVVDNMSIDTLEEYLNTIKITPTLMFREPIDKCLDRVNYALDNDIAVILQTKTVIPEEILEKMQKVRHSGIHVYIDSLRDLSLDSLDEEFSKVFDLQEQLFLAKSLMIFTALHIDYKPHLMSALTLYEIIDVFRNCIAHVLLECGDISDGTFNEIQDKWSSLVGFSRQDLKRFYSPNVQKRAWEMKENTVNNTVDELEEYLKYRKITMDVLRLENITSNNRIRHTSYRQKNKKPLGMRPFIFKKEGDTFENIPTRESNLWNYECPKCSKKVFSYENESVPISQ